MTIRATILDYVRRLRRWLTLDGRLEAAQPLLFLMGPIALKTETAQFARTLGTMLKSGVPVLGAMAVVGDMMSNQAFAGAISRISQDVKRGGTIAVSMREHAAFPPLAVHMVRVGEETGRLEEMLLKVAETFESDVRTDLVRAVVQVESGFNPWAQSPKGAAGLMQLMPATAQRFGVRNVFNPGENIRAGVTYLRELLDRYANNEQLALAAYNAGPGAVDKYGQNVPPYRETQNYVSRIKQIAPRTVAARPPGGRIFKTTEIVNGRAIPRYVNRKPADAELAVAR